MSIETHQDHLQTVLDRLADLSPEQLLTVQEAIVKELGDKLGFTKHSIPRMAVDDSGVILAKPTPEQSEAELREVFGDEYDEIMATDISNLPPLSKSVTEIIREGRDRY